MMLGWLPGASLASFAGFAAAPAFPLSPAFPWVRFPRAFKDSLTAIFWLCDGTTLWLSCEQQACCAAMLSIWASFSVAMRSRLPPLALLPAIELSCRNHTTVNKEP